MTGIASVQALPPGQVTPAAPAKEITPDAASQAKAIAEIVAAKQALAAASFAVQTDTRNRSPGCVSADQQQIAQAAGEIAQAKATVSPVGDLLTAIY